MPTPQSLRFVCFVQGTSFEVGSERKIELRLLAKHLASHYPNLGRGCRYLLQLAGDIAVDRPKPPKLDIILNGASPGVLRGAPRLPDAQPHVAHTLKVRFHRHF